MDKKPRYWGAKSSKLPFLVELDWSGSGKFLKEIVALLESYGEITDEGIFIFDETHGVMNIYYFFLALRELDLIPLYTSNLQFANSVFQRATRNSQPKPTDPNRWKSYKNKMFAPPFDNGPEKQFKEKFQNVVRKYNYELPSNK